MNRPPSCFQQTRRDGKPQLLVPPEQPQQEERARVRYPEGRAARRLRRLPARRPGRAHLGPRRALRRPRGQQERPAAMRPSSFLSAACCVGSGSLVLLAVSFWSARWRGGFSWDGSARQFNWHPVLMAAGLVVLCGHAVLVFRAPFTWRQKKLTWKLVHGGLMLVALLLCVLGLCAVLDVHRASNIPDMYSLHSWVGLCTVLLFAFQWLLGLVGFLLPGSPPWFRSNLKPVHVWTGKAILILGLTSCVSGINEQLFFTLNGSSGNPYNSLPAEAKFANSLGLLIAAFVLVVFGILSNDNWQRPEADNESVPLMLNENST